MVGVARIELATPAMSTQRASSAPFAFPVDFLCFPRLSKAAFFS